MTDQTPVTDDDRKAHEWCDMAEYYSGTDDIMDATARAIRAHVPTPPATLAEQILDIAGYISSDFGAYADDLTAIADRVEAVETELRDTRVQAQEEIKGRKRAEIERDRAYRERDEARANEASDSMQQQAKAWADIIEHPVFDGALGRGPGNGLENALYRLDSVHTEVERLTSGRTVRESRTVDLPDPADVPNGEAWVVRYKEEQCNGVKAYVGWAIADSYGLRTNIRNDEVTLVSRLVPDVRRVIDRPEGLDALPVGSVVVDGDDDPWKKTRSGEWILGEDYQTSDELLRYIDTSVRVIHEPEETP